MSIGTDLERLRVSLKASDRMPVVFLGHGSPMNAIQDNSYSRNWAELGRTLPRPQAILVISAHWMTKRATLVDVSALPRTIHDFGNFPRELFEQQYPAPGAPDLASEVVSLLASHDAESDESWGLDHGAWSVLNWLYPRADVPVFQVSIDMTRDLDWHLDMGRHLAALRDRGVLILGSGNIVHNLRTLIWDGTVHDWAEEFDERFAELLSNRDVGAIADRAHLGPLFELSHPTVDHYLPTLAVAGAGDERDELTYMNVGVQSGSISMRSFILH